MNWDKLIEIERRQEDLNEFGRLLSELSNELTGYQMKKVNSLLELENRLAKTEDI